MPPSPSPRRRPRSSPRPLTPHLLRLYRDIYATVRRIPRGKVATYGQIAILSGLPGGARVVGAALKASLPGPRIPWQRVLGKRGRQARISIVDPIGAAMQRQLLEREKVVVSETGHVALAVFGWKPKVTLS